jgi:hypothetical protein
VHLTPHLELLSDCNAPKENITVVMDNGNEGKVTTVGTVKGNAINQNGKRQGSKILMLSQLTICKIWRLKPY